MPRLFSRSNIVTLFLTLVVVARLSIPAAAQTSSGYIAGTVVDSQHAALVNATVTANEDQKKYSLTAKTDSAGHFVFAQVQPGTYSIVVQAQGFRELVQHGVVLEPNDHLALGEMVMQVGAVTEHVEVSAMAATLQTESAERSATLVSKQMENVAVNSRSPLALVGLAPGVISTANLSVGGPGGVANISANGVRTNSNQLNINGISNVDTGNNGGPNATLSLDSIAEFTILTGVYQAEYGRAMGAQINLVTKSGTNDFHGTGYFFHRNDSLNANTWTNNRLPIGAGGNPRSPFRLNDVGFTIGGPVIIPKVFNGRQKLFFFASEEFQRQLRPEGVRNVTVPTAAERAGDFSNSVDSNGNRVTVYDPTTSGCTGSNCYDGHLPFPNNVVPSQRLYAPGIALLKLLPAANVSNSCSLTPGAAGCIKGYDFTSQFSDQYPRREDLVRIDYNMSSKSRLFGHWIYNSNTYDSQYGSFVLGSNTPLSPIQYANPGRGWAVGHTYTFSPTLTNEFNIGSTFNSILIDETTNAYTRTTSGVNLPLLYSSAVQRDYIPNVGFGGKIGSSPNFGTSDAPFINHNTTMDITDGLSKIWGRHTMKFGTYIQRSWKDQTSFGQFNGNYNFGDSSANPLDTNFGFSNAALGVYNSFSQAANFINGLYRYWNFEFYAQDTWKITSRLSLDYGMRVAYVQPQYDASLQASTFVLSQFDPSKAPRFYQPVISAANCPAASPGNKCGYDAATKAYVANPFIGFIVPNTGSITNGISQGGQNGINNYLQNAPPLVWGPRFGAAWDVTGKQNFVVRTGFGIYYDRFQGNRVFDFVRNPPLGLQPSLQYGYASQISPASALIAPPTLYAADPTGKLPMLMSYQFSIQNKLPFGVILDTAFVGSQSRHLQDNRNLNYTPYGAAFQPSALDPTQGVPSLLGNNILLDQNLKPLRGFSNINLYEGATSGNYNSLQVTAQKTVGHLFFQMAYTWSRFFTNAPGDTNFVRVDSNTNEAYYGPSGNDRPENLALSYVYSIPDKGHSKFMQTLINGWQLSGVTAFQYGAPFTPGYSIQGVNIQNITGSTTEGARIAVVPGVSPNTGSDDPYNRINAAAFAPPRAPVCPTPTTCQYSIGLESGVNYLYGPGIANWDLSLQKTFKLTERLSMELRGDAFNVFNHTQFSGVNSTLSFGVLNPTTHQYGNATTSQNGVFGSVIGGTFIPVTPSNMTVNGNGSTNINGFGTVNGTRSAGVPWKSAVPPVSRARPVLSRFATRSAVRYRALFFLQGANDESS